jgi:transposase
MKGRKHHKGAVSKYSAEFRRQVALDYEHGDLSMSQVAEKHGIDSLEKVKWWVRSLRISGDIASSTPPPAAMTEQEKCESDAKDRRIKELERQLEDERLRSLAYSTMIDVAEEELGVPIRKKSGSQQSRG